MGDTRRRVGAQGALRQAANKRQPVAAQDGFALRREQVQMPEFASSVGDAPGQISLGCGHGTCGAARKADYKDSTNLLYSSTVRPMSRMSFRNRGRTITCLP
jgi:hypothetical protein